MMVCAGWSTTAFGKVGGGVAGAAAFGAGVGFAAKAMPQVRVAKRNGCRKSRVRIVRVNAFKSGRTKNKRFLCETVNFRRELCCVGENRAYPETFGGGTCFNVR